jgi:hypothetical protein
MIKKALLIVVMFCSVGVISAHAQSVGELGVRFGDVTGGNVALDGIIGLGQFSRIHANVSFGGNDGTDFGIDALWDFIYRPLGEEAFKWYVGAGPFFGFGNDFSFGAAGEIGLQYNFNIPLSLSLDWRPYFRLVEDTDFFAGGFGLNVRYVFGGGE